jgi:hypothetical protein
MPQLILVGVVLAVIYAGECWWFPFARCWCCGGSGKHLRKDRKVFRDCRWCRGSGRRLRVGRQVWNWWAARRREADGGR